VDAAISLPDAARVGCIEGTGEAESNPPPDCKARATA
jgi:hypothetical protein